ncbi:MAG: hypothetical protein U0229_04560 [Anaeromyxobacter sp.]
MRGSALGSLVLAACTAALMACGDGAEPVNPARSVVVPMTPDAGEGAEFALLHAEELVTLARDGFDVDGLFAARAWFGWHAGRASVADSEYAPWTSADVRGCSWTERGRLVVDCTLDVVTAGSPERVRLYGWLAWFPRGEGSGELSWTLSTRIGRPTSPYESELDEHAELSLSPEGMKGTVERSHEPGTPRRSWLAGPWWSVFDFDVGFDRDYVAAVLADQFPQGCPQPVARGTSEGRILVDDPTAVTRAAVRVTWSSCTAATSASGWVSEPASP